MTELRLCPFCGGGAELLADEGLHWAICLACGQEGPPQPDEVLARGFWNTRPAENELLDALGETVRVLSFAFDDGALDADTIASLCIDPYGMLADAKAVLAKHGRTP